MCLQGKSERNSEELNHVFYYQDDLSLLLREDELKGIIDTFDEEINPKGEYALCYNYLFPLSWDWGWGVKQNTSISPHVPLLAWARAPSNKQSRAKISLYTHLDSEKSIKNLLWNCCPPLQRGKWLFLSNKKEISKYALCEVWLTPANWCMSFLFLSLPLGKGGNPHL